MTKHLTLAGLLAGFTTLPAWAQSVDPQGLDIIGVPVDGKMGFQPAVTELSRDLQWLDGMILVIITVITIFVTGLMIWVAIRYNRKRNPTPANFTHHTPVEIAWTVVPIVILVAIGAWSLPILFRQQEIPVADVTIKAIGNQWYWTHEYVDEGFGFDSYMIGAPALGGADAPWRPSRHSRRRRCRARSALLAPAPRARPAPMAPPHTRAGALPASAHDKVLLGDEKALPAAACQLDEHRRGGADRRHGAAARARRCPRPVRHRRRRRRRAAFCNQTHKEGER